MLLSFFWLSSAYRKQTISDLEKFSLRFHPGDRRENRINLSDPVR
tara:strand:+ start:201 stop:335 length:135 start_codon:yes stop_codon:yes gene_type:complete